MFKRIIKIFIRELSLLFKDPKLFIIRWFYCFILNSIFWIDKDITYKYKSNKIRFPNKIWVSYVLMETFVYKIFSKMSWLNRVLDIWGFIWESAIYLSDNNKEIYCYELSKNNFEYLKTNCKNKKNIKYYNAWITILDNDYIEYDEKSGVDSTIKIKPSPSNSLIKIKNINIINLLKEISFDGLKLDIEGWEYNIIKYLIDNKLFNFKKWIIEFHDISLKDNLYFLEEFIKYIQKSNYKYFLITNENKRISISDLHFLNFCNIYFEIIIQNEV